MSHADSAVPPGMAAALSLDHVSKTFGMHRALRDVTATFPAGSITGLLGENGSGKSTLIKILSGYHQPDTGARIGIRGRELTQPIRPLAARNAGLRFVHQDLGLVLTMSIVDNMCFANGYRAASIISPTKRTRDRAATKEALRSFDIAAEPDTVVGSLSVADRTMVAIARAFHQDDGHADRRIMVLDEPTATLAESEVKRVLSAVSMVRESGGTVIYVTHRVDEVMTVADRVVVLRDGSVVAQESLAEKSGNDVVHLVLGRELPRRSPVGGPQIAGRRLLLECNEVSSKRLRGVSLRLHEGEILGVAGLGGSGKSELGRIVAGAQSFSGGTMRLAGRPYRPRSPSEALESKVALAPEDRMSQGIIAAFSVRANWSLAALATVRSGIWLNHKAERRKADAAAERYDIRFRRSDQPAGELSGGNQQKVVLAKCIATNPSILILDEPTQGIDVGAKWQILEIVRELSKTGVGVMILSSEDAELEQIAHTVIVLDRGVVRGRLTGEDISANRIARLKILEPAIDRQVQQ